MDIFGLSFLSRIFDSGTLPMELIETITIGSGGAASITRTQTADSKDYSLEGLRIDFSMLSGTTADVTIAAYYGDDTSICSYTISELVSSAARYGRAYITPKNGFWTSTGTQASATQGAVASYESLASGINSKIVYPVINKIIISSTGTMPEGSTISIYGIK